MAFDSIIRFSETTLELARSGDCCVRHFDAHVLDFWIREKAIDYLYELDHSFFEVVLVPQRIFTNVGGMIRMAQYSNPKWYQRFCAEFTSCRGIGRKKMRRARTYIKKTDCIRVLRLYIETGKRGGAMIERLMDFIRREVENDKQRPSSNFTDGIPF